MQCHCCAGQCKKAGFFGSARIQRYQCKQCGKTFSDIPERPFDDHRIPSDKAVQIVHLMVEGVGIRAIERLTGISRPTVLAVLQTVGEKCAGLLHKRLNGLTPKYVQVDEIWCYVGCKQRNTTPTDLERGDQYTYLAVDKVSKLIICHYIGKRNEAGAFALMADLSKRIPTRFQLTTDGFSPYLQAVFQTFGPNVDFSQLIKKYADFRDGGTQERRYSPTQCVGIKILKHIGYPIDEEICTSHVERTNLNVRLFTRRFTRLTLGFSKKLDNLKLAVALFVAHYNFCRVHGAHNQTPAQAMGLTTESWSIERLLAEASF